MHFNLNFKIKRKKMKKQIFIIDEEKYLKINKRMEGIEEKYIKEQTKNLIIKNK